MSSRFLETRTIANTHHRKSFFGRGKELVNSPFNIGPGGQVGLELCKINGHCSMGGGEEGIDELNEKQQRAGFER